MRSQNCTSRTLTPLLPCRSAVPGQAVPPEAGKDRRKTGTHCPSFLQYLIVGSTSAYTTSVSRFAESTTTAESRHTPMMTG